MKYWQTSSNTGSVRYFLHLNYSGTAYYGWQVQPGQASVQQTLDDELSTLLNGPVSVTGCGRTDSGVHARSYHAHFDWSGSLPKNFLLRLNKMLPKDIAIFSIRRVRDDAHARFDARDRTYKYFIHFGKDAFLDERSFWLHSYKPDIERMNAAAEMLCKYRDFRTFEKKGADNITSECEVFEAGWEMVNDNQWCFTIRANRFLRNMVRRITGALLMVGTGKLSLEELEGAVSDMRKLEVTFAPPAHGLFLWKVTYPESVYMDEGNE
jgi:tRNA pseudouridine38-40 synthase